MTLVTRGATLARYVRGELRPQRAVRQERCVGRDLAQLGDAHLWWIRRHVADGDRKYGVCHACGHSTVGVGRQGVTGASDDRCGSLDQGNHRCQQRRTCDCGHHDGPSWSASDLYPRTYRLSLVTSKIHLAENADERDRSGNAFKGRRTLRPDRDWWVGLQRGCLW